MLRTLLLVCFAVMVIPPATNGQSPADAMISVHLEKDYGYLETLYKDLHAHPELSFHEEKTSQRLAKELGGLNCKVLTGIGGHGLVGVMKNGPGPVVLVRADMDALPIQERTGVPFASTATTSDESGKTSPLMHACGHDMHMAVWVGVARALDKVRSNWHGTVIFLAQPAEERGAGALAMIKANVLETFGKPDFALALHVNSALESGKVGLCPGYSLANIDVLDITVKGKGGHGAVPELTIDPVVLASTLVLGFQTIVSREISPTEPAVITVGSIQGGSGANIVPDEVKLSVSIRSFNDDVQKQLIERIKRHCEGAALAAGLEKERFPVVTVRDEFTPSQYNDPVLTERLFDHFKGVIGAENVVKVSPLMFGEDFGWFGRSVPKIPILMYSLGSVSSAAMAESVQSKLPLPSTHSSKYIPDLSPTLRTGVLTMSSALVSLLQQ
nr:amidohydrolase [uncultured Dyadobacter sp.]